MWPRYCCDTRVATYIHPKHTDPTQFPTSIRNKRVVSQFCVHTIYSSTSSHFSVVIIKVQNQNRIYCTSKISTRTNSIYLLPQISPINNNKANYSYKSYQSRFFMRFLASPTYTDKNAVLNCFVACPTSPLTACVSGTTEKKTAYLVPNT